MKFLDFFAKSTAEYPGKKMKRMQNKKKQHKFMESGRKLSARKSFNSIFSLYTQSNNKKEKQQQNKREIQLGYFLLFPLGLVWNKLL